MKSYLSKTHPELRGKGALSAVIVRTTFGEDMLRTASVKLWKSSYEKILASNPSLALNTQCNEKTRQLFIAKVATLGFCESVKRVLEGPIVLRVIRKATRIVRRYLGRFFRKMGLLPRR